MIKEEEQLIQKLRNDLLVGADTMVSTGHNTEDELFPLFCKLFPNKSEKEVKGIYTATATKCELVYGAPCEAINTFDAISKLFVTYLYMHAKNKEDFEFDEKLDSIYSYVYSKLYMDTLENFYQQASSISLTETLDKEKDFAKMFAISLDRCGFKYPQLHKTEPGDILLEGTLRYKLTSVVPRKSKYPKVTSRVSYLTIGYDMFTLKFKGIE